MISILEILGIIGGVLLIAKVIGHALVIWSIDKKFPSDEDYSELEFLLPLINVPAKFKLTMKIINVIYFVAMILILVFIVAKIFF